MPYRIKEMLYTVQGEGSNAGSVVVLCRFEGCNLSCGFCDTDHSGIDGSGGGEYNSPEALAEAAVGLWQGDRSHGRVLCTGGEPLLQLDLPLLDAFHSRGFTVLLETNGTLDAPEGVDFLCVSPKDGRMPVMKAGDELKLPFPVDGSDPADYAGLDYRHFYLQPLWGRHLERNTRMALRYCLENPLWKLSLQMHKYIGIP